jgi:hypothetical protein
MLRTLGSDHIQQASESHRRATIFSAGRQIPLQRPNHSAGRRIPSPRRNHFSGPANPIAAPPSFQRAGESHRRSPQSFQRAGESHRRAAIISVVRQIPLRAAFFSAGRRISSPRRNHFSRPANPITAPQSFQQAGESHCCATIFSAIIIQHSVLSFKTHFKFPHLCWISSKQYLYLQDELSPSYIPNSKNLFNHAIIYQWQKVIGIVPAAITPDIYIIFFFQPRLCQAAKRDLGFKPR